MKLSIIIPVLNEQTTIEQCLTALQALRERGHEVIVADGGSLDATVELATPLADRVLTARRGRARQMNTGAALARGDVLWFLHADTLVSERAAEALCLGELRERDGWGRFDIRLSGARLLLRVVETLVNWRSRLSGIATGDQGIFVSRTLFERVGGFADLPLMEDIEFCRRLKRELSPCCLREKLLTSSRRWEQRGVLKTIALMWYLRLAYSLGVPPERLVSHYD
jgi:rSAM/selenodomain-associated transferase 2